jgi:hypothetical protein
MEDGRMRHRTVIAVGVMDVAAVAAALFLGLQSQSTPAVHRVTVAGTSPPSARSAQLQREETRALEAAQIETAARDAAAKAEEKRTRTAARAAARLSRQQTLRKRQSRHPVTAQSRATERETRGAPKPKTRPPAKRQHAPGPKPRKEARGSPRRHGGGAHAGPESKRRPNRRERGESRERVHAEREAARERRHEERQATARARQRVS